MKDTSSERETDEATEEIDQHLLRALLDGDGEPALERLEILQKTEKDPEKRIRYGQARVRLLVATNQTGEARRVLSLLVDELNTLVSNPGNQLGSWKDSPGAGGVATGAGSDVGLGASVSRPVLAQLQTELVLEEVVLASREGNFNAARAGLAGLAELPESFPEEPIVRAILETAALASLRGTALPKDVSRLLQGVPATTRASLEANLLIAEGDLSTARERLIGAVHKARETAPPEVRASLLLHLGIVHVLTGQYKQAIRTLKDARADAVEATEAHLYFCICALLATAYGILEDNLNAYAVCIRAWVSLEDLLGEGGGGFFEEYLETFREAWGEEMYQETALQYIELRKRGAIM